LKRFSEREAQMSIKWGVLGAGMIADMEMIPAIKSIENAELVSIMSRNEEKVKGLSSKHNIPRYYTDIDEFLRDPELDAVYVATAPHLHCEQTIQAAEHGKHVLCEKPMALAVEQCEKMIEAFNKAGVKLMIGCMMRFQPAHVKTKEIIDAGFLGRMILIRMQGSFYYPPAENWRLDPKIAGGGALHDMGIHCIDLMRFFAGDVEEVSAFVDNLVFDYPVEDTSLVSLRFANGGYGFLESCYSAYYTENRFEVIGSKGTLFAEKSIWGNQTTGVLKAFAGEIGRTHEHKLAPAWGQDDSLGGLGTVIKEYNLQPCNTFAAEAEYFSQCIMENREPEINGVEGLKDLQVVKAAYESAKEGKRVKIAGH
jgi:predicted dehydrogenase